MNMNQVAKLSGMMVLSMGLLLVASDADARGRRGKGGMGGRGGAMMKALDLTSAQRTEIERLRLDMQQETLDLRSQLREKHDQLRALWMVDSPDEKAIFAKHNEIDPLQKQLRSKMIKFRLAVHQLLTPEQRAKFAELGQHRRGGRGGMGGGHGMRGGMGGGFGGPGMDL